MYYNEQNLFINVYVYLPSSSFEMTKTLKQTKMSIYLKMSISVA